MLRRGQVSGFPTELVYFMLLLRVEANTLPSWNVISTEVEPLEGGFDPPPEHVFEVILTAPGMQLD